MYRIYTEDVNRTNIENILGAHVEGYTLFPAVGSWKGHKEQSLIIELADTSTKDVYSIAREIKQANRQDSVLVVHIPNEAHFV
jgi:uncharacterized membrane-anchored protein YitT (DUF2179 family)